MIEVGRRSGRAQSLGRVVGASVQDVKARPLGLALARSAMLSRLMECRALQPYAESASTCSNPSALREVPTLAAVSLEGRERPRQGWARIGGGEDPGAATRLDDLLDGAAVLVRPGSIVHAVPSLLSLLGAECPARGGAHGSRRDPRSASQPPVDGHHDAMTATTKKARRLAVRAVVPTALAAAVGGAAADFGTVCRF